MIRICGESHINAVRRIAATIVATAFSCGRKPAVNATTDAPNHVVAAATNYRTTHPRRKRWAHLQDLRNTSFSESGSADSQSCDRHYRGSGFLRAMLLWASAPQLNAAAAIAAQNELRLRTSFDKNSGCELKSRPIIGSSFLRDLLPKLAQLIHLRQTRWRDSVVGDKT